MTWVERYAVLSTLPPMPDEDADCGGGALAAPVFSLVSPPLFGAGSGLAGRLDVGGTGVDATADTLMMSFLGWESCDGSPPGIYAAVPYLA
jgi:hypothetical protein